MTAIRLSLSDDTSATVDAPDVVSQIYTAFRHGRVPLVVGGLIGALVPVGTFTIGHGELADPVSLQGAMVLGGLGFSAITVYCWGAQAFQSKIKAVCFVLLAELMMSFSATPWLSAIALAFLVAINAVANGSNLVQAHLAYVARQARRTAAIQADAIARIVPPVIAPVAQVALPTPALAPVATADLVLDVMPASTSALVAKPRAKRQRAATAARKTRTARGPRADLN